MKNRIMQKVWKIQKYILEDPTDYYILKKMTKFKRMPFYLKKVIKKYKIVLNIFFPKRLDISYVEMVLTTFCSLNCRGCSALMEYYSKREHIDLEKNIKSLSNLIDASDSIEHLRLLGGEPLLYPKLYDILVYLSKQDKVKKVTIVTNGTFLLKDNVIKILKNDKFYVFISNYGNVSFKRDELINQLKNDNIKYTLGDKELTWADFGNLECRNKKQKQLKKQYTSCRMMCNSLINGQLHHCPRSSHGTNINKIQLKEKDYINLLDKNLNKKQLRKKLIKFFYHYVPYIEACNYCDYATDELKHIPSGVQNK